MISMQSLKCDSFSRNMSAASENQLVQLPLRHRRLLKTGGQLPLAEADPIVLEDQPQLVDAQAIFSDEPETDSDEDVSPSDHGMGGDTSPESDPPSSDEEMNECTPPCFHWLWW